MNAAREVIRAAEHRAAALAAGDAEGLRALLHDEFRWTTHVGQTFDRSEYIRRNTQGSTVWQSQTLSDPQVVVVGDTAVLYAEVIDVVSSGDHESQTFRMSVTQVWVRVNGAWKCLGGHAGPRQT